MNIPANSPTLTRLSACSSAGWLDLGRQREQARRWIDSLGIRARSALQAVRTLSGGNQQKISLGRLLHQDAEILLLDEPTRGIDIGAKTEIYALIRQLAADGKAILLVSSELPEILALSSRLLVMREGAIAAELDPRCTTQEEVLRHAMPA